jgi:hypothetical protein
LSEKKKKIRTKMTNYLIPFTMTILQCLRPAESEQGMLRTTRELFAIGQIATADPSLVRP